MAPSAVSLAGGDSSSAAITTVHADSHDQLRSPAPSRLHIDDKGALTAALRGSSPVLTHINADTTWLLHLPYPEGVTRPQGRSHVSSLLFNVLLDPWLQGSQSDVASWFSTQEHIIPSSVQTIDNLNSLLGDLEGDVITGASHNGEAEAEAQDKIKAESYIDVVAISHEFVVGIDSTDSIFQTPFARTLMLILATESPFAAFDVYCALRGKSDGNDLSIFVTDHCHEKTLRELPKSTPVIAPDKAFRLIRSWNHFDTVIETPAFLGAEAGDWRAALTCEPLPSWIGIGRVVTPGNQLYYHSAIIVAFMSKSAGNVEGSKEGENGEAIIYSPHGINASDLAGVRASGIRTLALLHGLHDVRIWMTKQLNLGGLNGAAAARECRAKYWITTHDEVKKGSGFITPLLRRTKWSLAEVIRKEGRKGDITDNIGPGFEFVELGSGDGLILERS
ncbi:hypothetical protein GGR57DRAFT_512762 [Xylariaceae sp. FL1272]|nr:hypothetical protein GGR57DRAFT_512762 [Xylariaceae sp. FL1272]